MNQNIICTLTIFEELSSLDDEKDFFPQKYVVNNSFHSLINFRVYAYFYTRDFHEVQFTFYNKWTTPALPIHFNVDVKVQLIDNNENFVHSFFIQRNEFQKQTKHYSFISLIRETYIYITKDKLTCTQKIKQNVHSCTTQFIPCIHMNHSNNSKSLV